MAIYRKKDLKRLDAKMSLFSIAENVVFLSGQVAEKTRLKGTEDQTLEVLEIIEGILKSAGSSRTSILHATIHLTNGASFDDMNKAWNKFIGDGHEPSRTTVQAELYAPNCLIEITVIASCILD